MSNIQEIKVYLTGASACSYLPEHRQKSIVVDPSLSPSTPFYSLLASNGFRRSGSMIYRPHCDNCQACIPIRVPVNRFKPSRSQLRNVKKNADITVTSHPPIMNEEHFRLYCKYQAKRHPGSSMSNPTREEYLNFLTSQNIDTVFYEFRLEKKLIAIAVTDILDHGLSAVYTFYDPDLSSRSLGSYAILWQCQQTKKLELPWLYLGFWIAENQKMSYKINFQPAEGFYNQCWQTIFADTKN